MLDMTGLAQKFGAVVSHVRIGARPEALHAARILLGCDTLVAASADALSKLDPDRSHALVNAHVAMPGAFTREPDLDFPLAAMKRAIQQTVGSMPRAWPRRCSVMASPPTCSCWATPCRLLARRDPVTGHPRKATFGPWLLPVFRWLARLKCLRGTPFDPFGYSAERRLIADYETLIEELLAGLEPHNHATAVALASLPEQIRGFGHVKRAHLDEVTVRREALLAMFRNPPKSAAA